MIWFNSQRGTWSTRKEQGPAWEEGNGSDGKTVKFRSETKSWPSYKGWKSLVDGWLLSLDLFSRKTFLVIHQYFHGAQASSPSFLEHECGAHLTVPQWSLCNRLVWHQEKLLKNSPNQEAGQSTLQATSFGQYATWWQNKLSHREKKNTHVGCEKREDHGLGTRARIWFSGAWLSDVYCHAFLWDTFFF